MVHPSNFRPSISPDYFLLAHLIKSSLFLIWLGPLVALAQNTGAITGPGFPKTTFSQDQLFKPLGIVKSRLGHGLVSMHKGYAVFIFSKDGGGGEGGFSFVDISDPKNPKTLHTEDTPETKPLREAHGYGYSNSYGGSYVALQAHEGIQFWDWSNVRAPKLINYFKIPGLGMSDYDNSNWFLTWQAPYVIVGAGTHGVIVVDAHDIKNPTVLSRTPTHQTGGFRIGPCIVVGNLLVVAKSGGVGLSVMDFSDPKKPMLLTTTTDVPKNYSIHLNGNRILGAGEQGNLESEKSSGKKLHLYDLNDLTKITAIGSSPELGESGQYVLSQDEYAFIGVRDRWAKVDMRPDQKFKVIGTGEIGLPNVDHSFPTPIGNLVIITDDHGTGSAIQAHQAEPDTRAPEVNMVVPRDNATLQALTTRIGITLTDWCQIESITEKSFIVRSIGGEPLKGMYSHQTAIVNFSPSEPLKPNTTYEIVIPAGGIMDYSGNQVTKVFTSRFSTGATVIPAAPIFYRTQKAIHLNQQLKSKSIFGVNGRIFQKTPNLKILQLTR